MDKMPTIKKALWEQLIRERGPYCEMCYWRPATDPHHCIIRQMKGHPEYDVLENLEALCHDCHMDGYVDSYEHSQAFWARQVERGYKMQEWKDSLGLKYKEEYA